MHLHPRRTRRTSLALGSLAVVAAMSLSACGDDSDGSDTADDTSDTSDTSEPAETGTPEVETESPEVETDSEPAEDPSAPAGGTGTNPAWALPPVETGDLLTTIEAGDVTVDVYQVGTAKAEETGNFADPETNKPLIEVGDTLVFVNYVITNNGAPIDLGSSLVGVSGRYDDWPYLQGMDGLTGDELYEAQGIHDSDLAPGAFNEAGIYTLGTGETFSYGDNFEYQKNSPIRFDVTYTPVDDEGELLHDQRVESEGSAKIS